MLKSTALAFAPAIRRAIEPVSVVASQLTFDYVVFRVEVPAEDTGRMDTRVKSLSENLFREIAQEARGLLNASLLGRNSASRRALSPLKRIRDKLDGLSFLDHRVQPVINTLTGLLKRAPTTGEFTGPYLGELMATVLLLTDPDNIRRHGEGLLQVGDFAETSPIESSSIWDDWTSSSATDNGEAELPLTDTEISQEPPLIPGRLPEPAVSHDFWF